MAVSADILRRVLEIRGGDRFAERIRVRKLCEDAAIAIIERAFVARSRLWRDEIELVMRLLDQDVGGSGRFGELFSEPNIRSVRGNPLDLLNELFIEIYWRENLDAADSLIQRLRGVNEGLVSCLLYLKDRDRYNVMVGAAVEGIRRVFGVDVAGRTFREKYERFNELANKFKRLCGLAPQAVDFILWALTQSG